MSDILRGDFPAGCSRRQSLQGHTRAQKHRITEWKTAQGSGAGALFVGLLNSAACGSRRQKQSKGLVSLLWRRTF
jgi:hypothetical protein